MEIKANFKIVYKNKVQIIGQEECLQSNFQALGVNFSLLINQINQINLIRVKENN
jgi:hypothetical protein